MLSICVCCIHFANPGRGHLLVSRLSYWLRLQWLSIDALSAPNVTDLLISLSYTAAATAMASAEGGGHLRR